MVLTFSRILLPLPVFRAFFFLSFVFLKFLFFLRFPPPRTCFTPIGPWLSVYIPFLSRLFPSGFSIMTYDRLLALPNHLSPPRAHMMVFLSVFVRPHPWTGIIFLFLQYVFDQVFSFLSRVFPLFCWTLFFFPWLFLFAGFPPPYCLCLLWFFARPSFSFFSCCLCPGLCEPFFKSPFGFPSAQKFQPWSWPPLFRGLV